MIKQGRRAFMRSVCGVVAGALLPEVARVTAGWQGGPSKTRSDTGASADIAAVVRSVQVKHNVPGMIGAIVTLDSPVVLGASGIRKVGAREPMTAGDLIHLGSCTKAMTATLIGQLVQGKRLSLETKMREIFQRQMPVLNEEMANVTVAQLLGHRAGLKANLDWWSIDRSGGILPLQRLMAVKQALTTPPEQKPGSKFVYTNVGYMLLGAIIEAKLGQSWENAITTQLFRPLSMTSAGFGPPGTKWRVDQPWGHTVKDNQLEPIQHDNAPVLGPAGRVHSTMGDWAKYIRWCLQAEREDTKLLTAATQKLMLTPLPDSEYAAGWGLTKRDWAGGRALTHGGSNTMWKCVAWLAPTKGFAVLAVTNVAGRDADKACDELSTALIGHHRK